MATIVVDRAEVGGLREQVSWLLLSLFAMGTIVATFFPAAAGVASLANSILLVCFGLWHGACRYGWTLMSASVVVIFITGMILENVSILTGFPFGYFKHTDLFGPKLLNVPYLIGVLYFTLSYPAWASANLLLNDADGDRHPLSWIALPLVAMIIPAAIDATFDPVGATINHSWIFIGGGGYFGVPLSNFLGITLVNYVCFQLFAIYLVRHPQAVTRGQSKGWWLQPSIVLAIFAISPFLGMMTQADQSATDPGGTIWHAKHIYEGLSVASLCGIGFLALTTLLLALRRPNGKFAGDLQ